jgi:methylmalonyl-CoA mutase N-terminal domain/subunit
MKEQERKEKFCTDSGIEIKRVYTKINVADEQPGEFPFTRGVQETMYRSKFWTMRQYAGFSTAEESNKRYHYLLNNGTTGLSVAFDLPTQIGYDSSHDFADGEVGKPQKESGKNERDHQAVRPIGTCPGAGAYALSWRGAC